MASETTKEKRTSLTRRLIILTGFVIVALNAVQLLFVTSNAKKDIITEKDAKRLKAAERMHIRGSFFS